MTDSEAKLVRSRRFGRWLGVAAGILAVSVSLAAPSLAAGPFSLKPNPYKATTSREARESAVAGIPMDKLDEEARAKINSVLSQTSIFRRMPIRVVQCDPEMYLFLVRHPDVVVNIWEVLGVCQLAVRQVDELTFRVVDKTGTRGTVEFLYSSPTTQVIYSEGAFEGPPLTIPARGRTLLVLKSGYVLEPDGRYYITSRLDAFVHIEHGGVELLTKTFQPVVGRVADINFMQTAGFLGSVSRTAEVNVGGMQRLADQLANVRPEVREQFVKLSERVAEKAAELSGAGQSAESAMVARPEKLGLR